MNTEGTNNKPLKKGGEEMTKEEIKRILGKKKWTGVEVGRVFFNSAMLAMLPGSDREMIVPVSKIEEMTRTLTKRAFDNYKTYVMIYSWVKETIHEARQKVLYAKLRSEELLPPLYDGEAAAIMGKAMETVPVIMTKTQYQADRNRRIADVLDRAKSVKYSPGELLLMGIEYYLDSKAGKESQRQTFNEKGLEEIAAFNKEYSSLKDMGVDVVDGDIIGLPKEVSKAISRIENKYPYIVDGVRNRLIDRFPEIGNLTTDEEWNTKSYTGYDLIRANYMAANGLLADSRLFLDNYRATKNGIAILKPAMNAANIDEEGRYTSNYWAIQKILKALSISYFSREEGGKDLYETMKSVRKGFSEALYWLDGYNNTLDMIAKIYKVPKISIMKVHYKEVIDRANLYNYHVKNLESLLQECAETSDFEKSEKEKNLGTLHDVFTLISNDEVVVSDEKLDKIWLMLKDPETFEHNYKIMAYAGDPKQS